MAWTPRPLHSQVYPWAKGAANAKAAATQVPWQNSAQGHGVSYLTLLQCSFSQAAPNCCPAPGSVKHSSYSQGHHIFHLATTSDLAITWCTTYPSPSTCFLHNGKVLEPKFPFLHKDWCPSCWDFNRWWFPIQASWKCSLGTCMFIITLLQKYNRGLSVPYSFPTLMIKPTQCTMFLLTVLIHNYSCKALLKGG